MAKAKKETFAHEINVDLGDDEVLEYYDKAQEKDDQADKDEAAIRDSVKEQKEDVRRMRSEARKLREAAKERKERRAVQVYTEVRGSQVFYIEVSSGRDVDQRAATPEDLQETFPGLSSKPDDEIPLEPDYTPSNDDSLKVETEKKPRGKKAKRGR
jgi:hypothetical protein